MAIEFEQDKCSRCGQYGPVQRKVSETGGGSSQTPSTTPWRCIDANLAACDKRVKLGKLASVGVSVRYGPDQDWGLRVPDAAWDAICGRDAPAFETSEDLGTFSRRLMLFPERSDEDFQPVTRAD